LENLDRMELDGVGSPEEIAAKIHELVPDMPIPVPINQIAQKLDIIQIKPLKTEGFEGGLLTQPERTNGIIFVNENSYDRRKRFTIGHELGHFLLEHHSPENGEGFLCSSDNMNRIKATEGDFPAKMEVEANRFAVELLLPKTHFKKDLRRMRHLEIEHIPQLSIKYNVSKDAVARRYVQLQDEPCAIVISQNKKFLRAYRHPEFPFVEFNMDAELPWQSCATSFAGAPGTTSEWNEVDAGVWTDVEKHSFSVIAEQTLVQNNGFRMTLLTFDDEELEDDDEY